MNNTLRSNDSRKKLVTLINQFTFKVCYNSPAVFSPAEPFGMFAIIVGG